MIFQDLSCIPDHTMQEWAEKGILDMLGAYGGVMFSVSDRMKAAVNGIYDGAALGRSHYDALCQGNKQEIYQVETCKTVTWAGEEVMILHTTNRDHFRVFTILFRRGTPFAQADAVWGYKFLQLYYEKVLVINESFQDKEYIRNVFDSVDVAILTFDLEQSLVACNDFAMKLFSITAEHAFKTSREKQNKQMFSELKQVAISGERSRCSYLPFAHGDKHLLLSATISPMRNAKQVVAGVVMICKDVTERKLGEYELDQLRQYALLGEVAAGLAHDIKNPLMAIRGCTKLFTDDALPPDTRGSAVSIIYHELDRIDSVVSQTMTFSNLNGRQSTQWLQFNDVLIECVNICKRQMFGRSIHFSMDLDPAMPRMQARLFAAQQAFLNPLINATQAIGSQGQITLKSQYAADTQMALFSIGDDGIGMPKKTLAHMFTPCFTTKRDGTGMGLFVAKNVIERYGGTIHIDSTLDVGTVVTIRLPVTAGAR